MVNKYHYSKQDTSASLLKVAQCTVTENDESTRERLKTHQCKYKKIN